MASSSPAPAPARPGKMSAADFEFENLLGTGAFSKVVVGLYRPTNTYYAVKLISKMSILNAPSEEERTRMAEVARRESRMLLVCEHPNIVRFYASMQTTDNLVYVTELCSGGELLSHITRLGRIPLEAARFAIAELFSAIFYLHSGPKKTSPGAPQGERKPVTIIHRDIKPENVMLSADMHVKLIDFGTAVMTDSVNDRTAGEENANKGRAQTFCGTTYYMSPELLGNNYTCCASDYWGCGCVLFHMLTGERPFDASTQYLLIKTILEQEPDLALISDPLARDLVEKLLIKAPERRLREEEVRKHPFFASVNFAALHDTDIAPLWSREAAFVDEQDVTACARCTKPFGMFRAKTYCRACGDVVCKDCVKERRVVKRSRVQDAQPVCQSCADAISSQE